MQHLLSLISAAMSKTLSAGIALESHVWEAVLLGSVDVAVSGRYGYDQQEHIV